MTAPARPLATTGPIITDRRLIPPATRIASPPIRTAVTNSQNEVANAAPSSE